jgi:hypothetical protein
MALDEFIKKEASRDVGEGLTPSLLKRAGVKPAPTVGSID